MTQLPTEPLNELDARITRLARDPRLDNLTAENYVIALWELLGYIGTLDLDEWSETYVNNLLDRLEMQATL